MRKFVTLIIALALTMSGLVFSPARADIPSDGTYLCTTGVASEETPNFTIFDGVVSNGTSCAAGVVIPEGATSIEGYAFSSSRLTSITIPSSVTTIGNGAFEYAESLTSITIPADVTSIGSSAFVYTTSLTAFTVASENADYTSTSGVLFNKASTVIIAYPAGKTATTYSIPSGVLRISDNAFSSSRTTSITIPSGVTRIGNSAFSSSRLTSITIPASVTSIGNYAFENATSITSIAIPASVTSIGFAPFRYAELLTAITVEIANPNYTSTSGVLFNKLSTVLVTYPVGKIATSYSIPGTVTSIRDHAFQGATLLTSVTIPASVTSIGNNAFNYMPALTSVTIPSSVTSIGYYAFDGGDSLTSITVDGSNANYTSIAGVLFNKLATTLIAYPKRKIDASYSIPSSVTSIEAESFFEPTALTSITIPSSVTNIKNWAFENAAALSSVNFLGNEPIIEYGVFYGIVSGATANVAWNATGFNLEGDGKWNGLTVVRSVNPAIAIEAARVAAEQAAAKLAADQAAAKLAADQVAANQAVAADLAARTIGIKKKYSVKALAQIVGVTIVSPKAKVSISVAKTSKSVCSKSGSSLKTFKAGNCEVTFTVQEPKPKGGKKPAATKTVKTLVVQ